MIQDIEPRHLNHDYLHRAAQDGDYVAVFKGLDTFLKEDGKEKRLYTWGELKALTGREDWERLYLFAIDEDGFFLSMDEGLWETLEALALPKDKTAAFRTMAPGWMGFRISTPQSIRSGISSYTDPQEWCLKKASVYFFVSVMRSFK